MSEATGNTDKTPHETPQDTPTNTPNPLIERPGAAPEMDVHVIVLDHFARVLRALNEAMRRLERGEPGSVPDLQARSTEMRKAMQVVFEERKRSYDQAAKDTGRNGAADDDTGKDTGDDAETDLGRAREEIERRLARILRARRPG